MDRNEQRRLDARAERMRTAKGPLDIPCTHDGCGEMFATKNGVANHMRRVHGAMSSGRGFESEAEFEIRRAAIERIAPIAVRGGKMDSAGLWAILFTAPRRTT